MKKKILCMFLVVALLLTAIPTFADGGYYWGEFKSGFTSKQSFNKINDKTVKDKNVSCRTGGYTSGSKSSYLSILKVGTKVVSEKVNSSGGTHKWTGDTKGVFRVRVENQTSGTLYIRGKMFIYNGATSEKITDTSNYWGN